MTNRNLLGIVHTGLLLDFSESSESYQRTSRKFFEGAALLRLAGHVIQESQKPIERDSAGPNYRVKTLFSQKSGRTKSLRESLISNSPIKWIPQLWLQSLPSLPLYQA